MLASDCARAQLRVQSWRCLHRAQPEGCATEEGAGLSDQIGPQRARKPGNIKSLRDCPSEAGGKNEDGDVKSPLHKKEPG